MLARLSVNILFISGLVCFLSGCKMPQDSSSFGGNSNPVAFLSSTPGEAGRGSFLETSGGGSESNDDAGNGSAAIARVHNPEPATMLLWGVGLAGLACLKKRQKNIIN